jgi:hypothetical protein
VKKHEKDKNIHAETISCFVDKFEDNCVENDQEALSAQPLHAGQENTVEMQVLVTQNPKKLLI